MYCEVIGGNCHHGCLTIYGKCKLKAPPPDPTFYRPAILHSPAPTIPLVPIKTPLDYRLDALEKRVQELEHKIDTIVSGLTKAFPTT